MLDPMVAAPKDSKRSWECALNIIPNFVGHAKGSLDVWLSDGPVPFNAVWIEGELIAAGPPVGAASGRDAHAGTSVFSKGIIVADAGTAEYSTLTTLLTTFTDSFVGFPPAYVISRGSVKRAMGDH